ncbi:indole-3-glycerol phosphate synthase TrpC [Nanoarchaeota archaeon]
MILDQIINLKKREVLYKKNKVKINKAKLKKSDRDFRSSILKKSFTEVNLIAEIKNKSPSAGKLRQRYEPLRMARVYDKLANAVSVVTEEEFFGGSLDDLEKVRKATKLPILRKDFILDEYQIYESRKYGADAVLLIASLLSKNKINSLITLADKYCMDAIVEVHTKRELMEVLQTNAQIIGINNRNLRTMKINLNTTSRLAPLIPKNRVIVSESGISSKKDVDEVRDHVDAILVGTSLLKAKDVAKKIAEFK